MTDTWRMDHLGFYGNKWIKTPAADRLASESVIFEDAYPESLATIPVRRGYFTGKRVYPFREASFTPWLRSKDFRSWCYGWQPLAPNDVTITELLKANDYTTGLVADIPFYCQPGSNFHRAFDSYDFIGGKEYDKFRIRTTPWTAEITGFLDNFRGVGWDEDFMPSQVFRSAMKWLEHNSWRDKFYLHLELWDPHEFWSPSEIYWRMYNPDFEYENEEEELRLINPSGKLTDLLPEDLLPYEGMRDYPWVADYTERQIKQVKALYAGNCTQTDFWMGVFLEYARLLGVLDEAVVFFLTDHGTSLGEHGVFRKPQFAMYDQLLRLPMTIRLPDKSYAGKRVSGFNYVHDWPVTLLNLLGIEKHEDMEGVDVMPLVTGEKEKLRDYVITGYNNFVSVRDEKWHYITADRRRIKYGPEQDRLYDVPKDTEMETNVIKKNAPVVKEMNSRILKLWKEYGLEYKQP